jgi:hypothetical protein
LVKGERTATAGKGRFRVGATATPAARFQSRNVGCNRQIEAAARPRASFRPNNGNGAEWAGLRSRLRSAQTRFVRPLQRKRQTVQTAGWADISAAVLRNA